MRGEGGVAGEGRVVGLPKFHSWGKCTIPLTNINSDWMYNASSGLCIWGSLRSPQTCCENRKLFIYIYVDTGLYHWKEGGVHRIQRLKNGVRSSISACARVD